MADKKDEKEDAHLVAKKEGASEGGADGGTPEGAEAGDGTGGGLSGKKKIIIIAAGVVLLIVAGGAGAYFTGALDKILGKAPDCTHVEEGDEETKAACAALAGEEGATTTGAFIDIPDLIVNLSAANTKQPHFLKISLKIEIEKKEDEKALTDLMPRIIDQFQTYLRELRMEDLRGSSGLYRMKIELITRARAVAPGIKVRDVLFQEILVQ